VGKETVEEVQEAALECLSHLISTVIGHEKMHLALELTLQVRSFSSHFFVFFLFFSSLLLLLLLLLLFTFVVYD
jgi:hypothetical protein